MSYIIRPVSPDDSPELLSVYAPYVTDTVVTFEYEAPSEAAFRQRVADIIDQYPYLVAVENGRVIGYAYAHRARERAAYDWFAELSVYVRSGHSGQGIGTALYSALIPLLKLQNIQHLTAVISAPNAPSEALHQKMGFSYAGIHKRSGYKLGQWRDTLFLDLPVGSHAVPPPPFIPFSRLDQALVMGICAKYSTAR